MTKRQQLLDSIAETSTGYRSGELAAPTPEHVDRWVKQFRPDAQLLMLSELNHVLGQTYYAQEDVRTFLRSLVKKGKLAGDDPCQYWGNANFLDIQKQGHSQKEMLSLFGEVLEAVCGLSIERCGSKGGDFIYLDDAIFSGSHAGNDLIAWIENDAPPEAQVQVISIVIYSGSEWVFRVPVPEATAKANKKISIHRWYAIELENQRQNKNSSAVFWPTGLPDDPVVQAYAAAQDKFPFESRQAGGKLSHPIFATEQGRQILEEQLLIAGAMIRSVCDDPKPILRPLGFSRFGLGFGATIVTYRNCPNNAPLALWWGDPTAATSHPLSKWYPLFPRNTYGPGKYG